MQPNFVVKPAFTIVGMKVHGKNEHGEIPQLWGTFGTRMHEVQHVAKPRTSYGVMDNYDETTGEFDYIAALEVEGPPEPAEGMIAKTIPAQTYAVFPTTLPTFRQTYDQIYQRWLPKSGYQHAVGPEFELYGDDFDPIDPDAKMFLYIPVEPVREHQSRHTHMQSTQ